MATELSALPANHPRITFGKVGVLLVNLGTPDGTDYWPMRRYLAEFLSDKRVIEWSRLYWYQSCTALSSTSARKGRQGL